MSETEPKFNTYTMRFDDDSNPSEFLIDGRVVWRAAGCSCGNEECDRESACSQPCASDAESATEQASGEQMDDREEPLLGNQREFARLVHESVKNMMGWESPLMEWAERDEAPSPTNPKHYAVLNPQPWDVIDAWGMDYFSGSVLKYLSRWRNKNGLEDLLKARTFLDKLIAIEEGK